MHLSLYRVEVLSRRADVVAFAVLVIAAHDVRAEELVTQKFGEDVAPDARLRSRYIGRVEQEGVLLGLGDGLLTGQL